jgi:ABC-type Na+ efflux pump permease subunit
MRSTLHPSVLWAVATKDLRESAANSQVLLPVVILPVVFVVLYPVGLLIGLRFMPTADAGQIIGRIPASALPGGADLTVQGRVAYLATVYLFAAFFLIIPVMVATVLAANSFAGEKERHTLEGVLYTPVTDTELVVGKIVGAVAPAVGFSWVCFALYTALVNVLGNPLVGRFYFPTLNWWVLMLLVVPAVSVFVTACVVWVSARVNTYQAANSIGGFAVLPAVLLVVGQVNGVMLAGPLLFAVLGVVLLCLDVLLVRWIVSTFDRERVVTSFL